jgi:hypothetical protein
MKHSQILFNKDLYDLTFVDVSDFFNTVKEESLNLEFKSFPQQGDYASKEAAVKKAVCGLLNSEGGIIIWGAPTETKHANGNTTAIGPLTPFTSPLDRDRMINILSSTISPMPVGIRVQVLKNANDESIFVIEVEKSIERPHQYDNRYYVRLDGQTRIAPHYLISALMKSTDFPVLRGHIRLKRIETDGFNYLLHFKKLLFNTTIYNNDININMRLLVVPGIIIINNINQGALYNQTFPIISNGAPLMSNFILQIPAGQIHQDIRIVFQFGGEKSPSKTSQYTYQLIGNVPLGVVQNENIYLTEKSENKLPSEVSSNTIDENINQLLDI